MALNGWVRIDRDDIRMLSKSGSALSIWCLFLERAHITPTWCTWRGMPRQLPVGGFIISQKSFAEDHGFDRKAVSKAIRVLTKFQFIESEIDPNGTIIVIKKLECIKDVGVDEGQPRDNPGTTSGQPKDNPGTTLGHSKDNQITREPDNQTTREPSCEGGEAPALDAQESGTLVPEVIEPEAAAKSKRKSTKPAKTPTDGSRVWAAYAEAYRARYQCDPVRNETTSSQCVSLVKRLGVETACEVVRFYVRHNDRWYVQKSHPIGQCLTDAEGLCTQWRRGRAVTSTEAQRADQNQSNAQVFTEVYQELRGKHEP